MQRIVGLLQKMRIKIKQTNIIIFIIFSFVILFNMLTLEPRRYGDGNEYFLMLESLTNHFSPDLQQKDIDDFYNGDSNLFGENISPYFGYLKNKENKWYSIHFWVYSLSAVPVKLVLEFLNLDVRKSFQITNALLFILMLAFINFFSNLKEGQKLLFMLLITLSPALWFVHWTHSEVFMLVLVIISLIFLNKNKYSLAIILASIASFQNQALVFFVLFLLIKAVLISKKKLIYSFKYGLLSLLVFVPNIFYLITFRRFSLLGNATFIKNISVLRIFEMFFDLNIGIFPYLPLTLLLFLGIVFFKTYKERKFTSEFQIFLLLIAMMAICSMNPNWNHGTVGPTRYVVWMLPFIFLVVIKNTDFILDNKILKYIFVASILLQFYIVLFGGPLVPKDTISYVDHSYLAEMILNNFPSLYNPSYEIFCERTMHKEVKCNNPAVYIYNEKCKKALLTCERLEELKFKCGIPLNSGKYCEKQDNNEKWFYVNY